MRALDRLLRPRSIAVIGGGAWCRNVIAQCRKIGFPGDIWPVHPNRESVGDLPAFARIEDLPAAPDAAFIGINREATIEAVEALAHKGAGGAVCFASGFREAQAETGDGATRQDALLAAAGDMPILGPNCYGFLNYVDGATLWPDQHGGLRVDCGVAIVTQSSNIALNLTMQRRGLPLAYVVTAGNQAQTDLAAIGQALLEDPRVTALGLHIEGIADLRRFEEMARAARALGKPVVALKVGESDHARAATLSHTASLAGSRAGARALFERLGIARVTSLSALLETLKLLHVTGPLESGRIASMSCSGGEACLVADTGIGLGVQFPALTEEQSRGLRGALGPKVALANPLDYHTYSWADRAAMARTFAAMMAGDLSLGVVVLDFPRADRCTAAEWDLVVEAVADAAAESGKPMALLSSLPETLPEETAQTAVARGITPLCGLSDGLQAIAAAADIGQRRAFSLPPILVAGPLGRGRVLTEADAKRSLSGHGLEVPRARSAGGASEAASQAAQIGLPVVVKGLGAAHKTEAGLVALNLTSAEAVREAAARMAADSFLVEEMITGGVAELIVGVLRDPAHGFVLTLGAGGALAELLDDTVSLLLPTNGEAVEQAIGRLRVAPLLEGFRGGPPADMDAIIHAVLAVQGYVTAHDDRVIEVEINPLICTPDRAIAADALIHMGDPT